MRYALALAFVCLSSPALAKHHHRFHHHHRAHAVVARSIAVDFGRNVAEARSRGLPWCGAYMADLLGYTGELARELWTAREWADQGTATSPHDGAVIVWAHHVGKLIRHVAGDVWIVLSGNDGHRVRERPRSIRGYIAVRDVPNRNMQVAAFFDRA